MLALYFPRATKTRASAPRRQLRKAAEEAVPAPQAQLGLPIRQQTMPRKSRLRKHLDDHDHRLLFKSISINCSSESFLFPEFPNASIQNCDPALTVQSSISRPLPGQIRLAVAHAEMSCGVTS